MRILTLILSAFRLSGFGELEWELFLCFLVGCVAADSRRRLSGRQEFAQTPIRSAGQRWRLARTLPQKFYAED